MEPLGYGIKQTEFSLRMKHLIIQRTVCCIFFSCLYIRFPQPRAPPPRHRPHPWPPLDRYRAPVAC